jgi:hypothetical protein
MGAPPPSYRKDADPERFGPRTRKVPDPPGKTQQGPKKIHGRPKAQKNTDRRCTSSLYRVCWICSLTWSVRLNISIGSSAASGG